MCSLKLLAVLFFANCVFADYFFTDCLKSPQFEECRKEEFLKFLKEFSAGNPDKGIKPMDPMELGEVTVPEETLDILFVYKHFKVTGLKDVIVTEHRKEKPGSSHIFLKFDYVAEGPVVVKYTKKDKVISGTVKYKGGVNGELKYSYSGKTVDGKVVPEIGQETVICEPVHVMSTIDEELKKTLDSDADIQAVKEQYDKIHKQHQEKVMCETVKAVFKVIVENIRALLHKKSLIEPCLVTDIDCVSRSTQIFLDNTSGGIPEYDIRPLDPITIPSVDVTPEGVDVTFHFKNIVVKGFRNQKISSFQLDKDNKQVNLKTKVDLVFDSDVSVELHKSSKSHSGTVRGEANVEGNPQYSYSFINDDKGVEHYEVGPETISCQVNGDPKFTVNPELLSWVQSDPDIQKEKEKYNVVASKTRQDIICEVAKLVYVTAVHNIRASARILPKSAYFKDV